MSETEDRLLRGMRSWKARHDRLRDAVLESGVAIQIAGGCDMSPPTLYVGTDFTKTLKDAVKDYERVARQFAEVGEILGQGADSLPTTARFIVAERDQLRRDLESVQDSLDEQHEVVVPHVAASLPEPDATNPDHVSFAAEIVGETHPKAGYRAELNDLARRLDAARSAERQREQRIEQAARAILDFENSQFDHQARVIPDIAPIDYARALDAAGLLRGGGRGE